MHCYISFPSLVDVAANNDHKNVDYIKYDKTYKQKEKKQSIALMSSRAYFKKFLSMELI